MRAISCCCAGDGPGLRRAPARLGPPGGGPGGPEPGGRWPLPGPGDPGAVPAADLGHGAVPGSSAGFGQGDGADSDEAGRREVLDSGAGPFSAGGLEAGRGLGQGERPPPVGGSGPADCRGTGGVLGSGGGVGG
jgi:hypothetical protein